MSVLNRSLLGAALCAALAAPSAFAAVGDTLTYQFNSPSTGGSTPSISQATLLLTETATGVNFTLTPNWAQTTGTWVERLDFAYSGQSFSFVDGAGPTPITVATGFGAIDSGYSSTNLVTMKWASTGAEHFNAADASASWSFQGAGLDLTDFMVMATSNAKPSPSFGVVSMPGAVPSNWVAGMGTTVVPSVPEPETYALMVLGLGVVGFAARRRKQAA